MSILRNLLHFLPLIDNLYNPHFNVSPSNPTGNIRTSSKKSKETLKRRKKNKNPKTHRRKKK